MLVLVIQSNQIRANFIHEWWITLASSSCWQIRFILLGPSLTKLSNSNRVFIDVKNLQLSGGSPARSNLTLKDNPFIIITALNTHSHLPPIQTSRSYNRNVLIVMIMQILVTNDHCLPRLKPHAFPVILHRNRTAECFICIGRRFLLNLAQRRRGHLKPQSAKCDKLLILTPNGRLAGRRLAVYLLAAESCFLQRKSCANCWRKTCEGLMEQRGWRALWRKVFRMVLAKVQV